MCGFLTTFTTVATAEWQRQKEWDQSVIPERLIRWKLLLKHDLQSTQRATEVCCSLLTLRLIFSFVQLVLWDTLCEVTWRTLSSVSTCVSVTQSVVNYSHHLQPSGFIQIKCKHILNYISAADFFLHFSLKKSSSEHPHTELLSFLVLRSGIYHWNKQFNRSAGISSLKLNYQSYSTSTYSLILCF